MGSRPISPTRVVFVAERARTLERSLAPHVPRPELGPRRFEQASAAGMPVQQYLRNELTRIAGRRSPAEFVAGREPMSRAEFEAIRRRLRTTDAA